MRRIRAPFSAKYQRRASGSRASSLHRGWVKPADEVGLVVQIRIDHRKPFPLVSSPSMSVGDMLNDLHARRFVLLSLTPGFQHPRSGEILQLDGIFAKHSLIPRL
jgi:hypothetical protein